MQVLEQQVFITPQQNEHAWTSSDDNYDEEKPQNSQEESFIDYEPYLAEALNVQNNTQ